MTLDYWVNKCPMFNNYLKKWHNVEIKPSPSYTLCEIDDLYVYPTFYLLGENKIRDSLYCHRTKIKQFKRFKRYENCIKRYLGLDPSLPVYYFYAHFDNEKTHIEFEGIKK